MGASLTQRSNKRYWDEVVEPAVVPATSFSLLDETVDWIVSNFNPADIFPEKDLVEWATENGYVKEAKE